MWHLKKHHLEHRNGSCQRAVRLCAEALWAVGLIDDVLVHLKNVGINDHEFTLLESAQPKRVREKRNA